MRLQGAPLHDAVAEGWDLRAAATVCEVEFAEILCMRGGQCNKAQRPSCASIRTSTLIGRLQSSMHENAATERPHSQHALCITICPHPTHVHGYCNAMIWCSALTCPTGATGAPPVARMRADARDAAVWPDVKTNILVVSVNVTDVRVQMLRMNSTFTRPECVLASIPRDYT